MTPILYRNSCAPKALSILFKDSYDSVCRHLQRLGADYKAPAIPLFERLLEERAGIKRKMLYTARPPKFAAWRRMARRGKWVTIVEAKIPFYYGAGHCVVLRDGAAFDNNWISCTRGALRSLRVHCAYELQT